MFLFWWSDFRAWVLSARLSSLGNRVQRRQTKSILCQLNYRCNAAKKGESKRYNATSLVFLRVLTLRKLGEKKEENKKTVTNFLLRTTATAEENGKNITAVANLHCLNPKATQLYWEVSFHNWCMWRLWRSWLWAFDKIVRVCQESEGLTKIAKECTTPSTKILLLWK